MKPYEALERADLFTLEKYSEIRSEFRAQVMQHKKHRRLLLGDSVMLYFEDRLTMQYQIQEMLRAEKIFDAAGINEELEAYNPLIPNGSNLKATMMVQIADVTERVKALSRLIGIEDAVWMQVQGHDRITPVCDEDLERDTEDKTSSVHFMRFEFSNDMIADLKSGKALSIGIDHPEYQVTVSPVADDITAALSQDFR